jgi:hypothetical protein
MYGNKAQRRISESNRQKIKHSFQDIHCVWSYGLSTAKGRRIISGKDIVIFFVEA